MQTTPQTIIFVTGNANKVAQVTKWIGMPLAHHKLDLDELQTLDLREVVEHKVRQAYTVLQKPVLVEDVSLTLTAMGRLPGTFIKWFIEELGVAGLARIASGLEHQQVIAEVGYGLYDGQDMRYFTGEMRGTIVPEPRGTGGFGFDAIFMSDGYDVTRAEMTEEDYAATSYRNAGLAKLRDFLNS